MSSSRVVGGKSLPYDAEIEYLESTGDQWIDTGIDGNSIYGLEFIFINCNISYFAAILSCVLDDFTLGYYGSGNRVYLRNRGSEIFVNYITPSSEQNLLITSNKATFNGVTYQITTPIAINSQNLLIANSGKNPRRAPVKCKRLKLYQDALVRDMIPVRVGNVGYMYDKVSGQLFGNAGTGKFILGPDVNSTIFVTPEQQRQMYE